MSLGHILKYILACLSCTSLSHVSCVVLLNHVQYTQLAYQQNREQTDFLIWRAGNLLNCDWLRHSGLCAKALQLCVIALTQAQLLITAAWGVKFDEYHLFLIQAAASQLVLFFILHGIPTICVLLETFICIFLCYFCMLSFKILEAYSLIVN